MRQYDTSNLISIVDTAYCFDIYGADGFSIIKYVNQKMKICPEPSKEKYVFKNNEGLNFTEVFAPFKCINNDSLSNDSFYIVFRFFDYERKIKLDL